jgi:hypothetical protein
VYLQLPHRGHRVIPFLNLDEVLSRAAEHAEDDLVVRPDLEDLLSGSTLVTANSLMTRYAWEPVRSDPAFQAMLDRHR